MFQSAASYKNINQVKKDVMENFNYRSKVNYLPTEKVIVHLSVGKIVAVVHGILAY